MTDGLPSGTIAGLLVACLMVAVPLTSGLRCYVCDGSERDDPNSCVDANVHDLESHTCIESPGLVARCSQEKTISETQYETVTRVTRACFEGHTDTEDGCTEHESDTSESSRTMYLCYCSTDSCNGQTKQTSGSLIICVVCAILTMLVSRQTLRVFVSVGLSTELAGVRI